MRSTALSLLLALLFCTFRAAPAAGQTPVAQVLDKLVQVAPVRGGGVGRYPPLHPHVAEEAVDALLQTRRGCGRLGFHHCPILAHRNSGKPSRHTDTRIGMQRYAWPLRLRSGQALKGQSTRALGLQADAAADITSLCRDH